MNTLLQLKNASLRFGNPPILDNQELLIQANERICLVGRNGCGKSTLLKVIAGEQVLDDGQRLLPSHVKIARLAQDPPVQDGQTVFDFVADAFSDTAALMKRYFQLTRELEQQATDAKLTQLSTLQHELEHRDAWQHEQQIQQVLSRLQLDPDAPLAQLSGGWRRKTALARALVQAPDILLLDEPTNHLDVQIIQWLEQHLLEFPGTIVFVSHDRAFIRALATRIVDLDRGILNSFPGSYHQYVEEKQRLLDVEQQQNAEFDKKLSKEEAWIRQGIKARRTRNEGRVRALKALREEHQARQQVLGQSKVSSINAAASGKIVFACENLGFQIEDKVLVKDLDLIVQRGDKLALLGPNGVGKTTLLKLLLGDLKPQHGDIQRGTKLEVAYFDQHRLALDPEQTVIDAIADGKREVTVNGRSKHVISYLQDYLFTPERLNSPVKALSGGERNRLLLAKLMLKPSNLLVLDEPTNDLDVETLELLEDILQQYPGTVILVSHDREFVDNVVTSSLFFAGEGRIQQFTGGYQAIANWYSQAPKGAKTPAHKTETLTAKASPSSQPSTAKTKKLSYKHQRELDALPAQIEQFEQELASFEQEVSDPHFYQQDSDFTHKRLEQMAQLQKALEQCYQRWDELESMTEQ